MIKKRKDLPEPFILHELGRGISPEAVLYVSRAFREYVDKHWGMQTTFSPPTPRGCLLDEMFPNVMVDETLPAGQVEFVWREGDAVVRRGFHYIKLSESQAI